MSADGNHAYVTGQNDDAINLERNISTGASYGGMLKDGVNLDGLDAKSVTVIGREARLCHGLL